MTVHHVAIRIDKVGKKHLKKFSTIILDGAIKILIAKELSEKVKKWHYHAYATFEIDVTEKYHCEVLRGKIRETYPKIEQHQFCVQNVKTLEKYLKYVTKDSNIQYVKSIDEHKITELLKDADRVRREKKNKMKTNLLEAAKKWKIYGAEHRIQLSKLYYEIIMYHVQREFLPPTRSLLTQYAAYIVTKITPQDHTTILEVYNIS